MEGRTLTRGQTQPEAQTPFPHPQARGSDDPHIWAASQRTLQQKRASGTIMTTTLIYEPIAHISDDYFSSPKADGYAGSRDNITDQGAIETRRLALNITDRTQPAGLQLTRNEQQIAG